MTRHDTADDDPITASLEDDSDEDEAKSKARTYWLWFMEALTAGVRISVIAGVIFTGFQYYGSIQRERTQRAFELVELWQSDRMQAAGSLLKARLSVLQKDAAQLFPDSGKDSDPKFAQKLIGDMLLEQVRGDEKLSEAYTNILYFLNRVSNCAASRLCNASVLGDFFKDYAREFWDYFGESLSQESKQGEHPIKRFSSSS